MSDLALLKAVLAAGEAITASTALPALAFVAAKAFPKNAARRHLVWATALGALVALPLLAATAPSLTTIALPAPPALAPTGPVDVSGPGQTDWIALLIPGILLGLTVVWALGVAWVAGRALVAMLGLELLRRRGSACPPEHFLLGAARTCELRFSEDCPGPMTWGVARPVVMLPWAALGWSKARLDAVLRHELAHVRRRDALTQAVALIACALYWPNPLVWRAANALRREAEAAADDAVIAAGVRPSDYATELLQMAREWRGQRPTPAMAMAAPAALTERVQSILSTDPHRTGATAMDTLKLAAAGGLITAALVLARPSLAEPQAPAAKPPAPPAPVAELLAPAPPAVAAMPATPAVPAVGAAPAAPSVPASPKAPKAARNLVIIDGKVIDGADARPMTPEEKADLDRQLAEIAPRVQKAIADAHIAETVAREVEANNARTQAQLARQMAELQPKIQKAIADARISERVAQRMAEIQPRIDAAIARAQQKAEAAQARAEAAREAAERRANP